MPSHKGFKEIRTSWYIGDCALLSREGRSIAQTKACLVDSAKLTRDYLAEADKGAVRRSGVSECTYQQPL